MPLPDSNSIRRDELLAVIDRATQGITPSTRAKLLKVAYTTDAVAVNWWHCDGVNCPSRQAGVKNQTFQSAYDEAMRAIFDANDREPFVVTVADAKSRERN